MTIKGNASPQTTFVVEFFGLPIEVTDLPKVEVTLLEGADMTELLRALRQALPRLVGQVIKEQEESLTGHYAFNINGQFYFGDSDIRLHQGDRIVLVLLASGG